MTEPLRQDIRHAFAHLRRTPGLTCSSVLMLALVMATAATLFSVTNAIVLRRLPVADADRLVAVSIVGERDNGFRTFSYAAYLRFIESQDVLAAVFGFRGSGALDLQAGDVLTRGVIAAATPEMFTSLGLTPVAGRFFTDEDAPRHGEPARVVAIGYRLWQRLFGGDVDVVGRTLVVRGQPLTVIGVLPESFVGLEPDIGNDFYIPLTLLPHVLGFSSGSMDAQMSHLVGRLPSGMTMAGARASIEATWAVAFEAALPTTLSAAQRQDWLAYRLVIERASSGFSSFRTQLGQPIVLLTALASTLLLIGCVNLAGLALARWSTRQGSTAVLLALGAPRYRVVRVLMIESLMLSFGALILILPVTWLAAPAIGAMLWRGSVPLLMSLTPDATVLAAIAMASVTAAIIVGVVPAWVAVRTPPQVALQRHRTGKSHARRPLKVFIVLQVAASLVLLAMAGLFAKNLMGLSAVDSGFRQRGLVFGRAWQLPGSTRTYDEQTHYPELVRRLEALPGVESVALSQYFPGYLNYSGLSLENVTRADASENTQNVDGLVERISPRFFETAGAPLLRGRDFTWADREGAHQVAIINEALERRLFPLGDAVGSFIRVGNNSEHRTLEIVGVSSDITVGNLRSPRLPTVFRARMQGPEPARVPILLLETSRGRVDLLSDVESVVRGMGHEHVRALETIEEQLKGAMHQERLLAAASSTFGVIAVVVAFVGLYALLSHIVVLRTSEIGLRMALGATRGGVSWLVMRQAMGVAAMGVACGLPVAFAVARSAESLFYQVDPADPRVFVLASSAFVVVAVAAVLLPVRRALRINPVEALRAD